ncbi:3-hydroxyisobutyrate dehydrogenase, partial [Pseudomonas syringae pv. primulae]
MIAERGERCPYSVHQHIAAFTGLPASFLNAYKTNRDADMTLKTGVIGLGNMGGGMAATLASKGFDVSGFDLSSAALAQAESKGVKPVAERKQLIQSVDILILSLPKAEHVESVCLGAGGISEWGHEGLIVVDTTTSTPEMSRKVAAELAKTGIAFIDAPVSGGPKGAATGTMSMVIGAEDADLARAMPV